MLFRSVSDKTARGRAVLSLTDHPAGIGAENQVIYVFLWLGAQNGFVLLRVLHGDTSFVSRVHISICRREGKMYTIPVGRLFKNRG